MQRKTIIIQITENCNLNCSYCYQHGKTINKIELEQVKSIISQSFQKKDDFDEIEFDFIGGEPLLYPDLIMETCNWTWQQKFNKPYIFFVNTNGTLLRNDFKIWARLNRDKIWLGLSLDGTKEMHDINRNNSYDKIDVNYFIDNWPEQAVKMTISPLTLKSFSKGVIDIHKRGFRVNANLAYGVDWSGESYKTILSDELAKLIEFYLKNESIIPIRLLNMPLFNLLTNNREKYCGTGTGMAACDIYAKKYPCQLFYNLTIKDEAWRKYDFNCIHENYYSNCYSKEFFNLCPICIGINFSQNNVKFKCDKHLCQLMHVFFKANAYFQFQQLKNKTFNGESPQKTLEAIRLINNILYYIKIL
ncbi:MAG: radical SAM protein [Paludibacteraceae bacterium]